MQALFAVPFSKMAGQTVVVQYGVSTQHCNVQALFAVPFSKMARQTVVVQYGVSTQHCKLAATAEG